MFYEAVGRRDKAAANARALARNCDAQIAARSTRETLIAMNNLARCYRTTGRYDARRVVLHEQDAELVCKSLGTPSIPNTLAVMNNLALSYQWVQGRQYSTKKPSPASFEHAASCSRAEHAYIGSTERPYTARPARSGRTLGADRSVPQPREG